KLGRSVYSVKARASTLDISLRVVEGYSRQDLCQLLGAGVKEVRTWIQNGWIKLQGERITERSVISFLRRHPEEYQLSRVDEAWFKGLLFPSFGRPSNKVEGRCQSQVVDNTSNVGQFPSLALDSHGTIYIAYYDAASGSLRLAHSRNATGSAPVRSIEQSIVK